MKSRLILALAALAAAGAAHAEERTFSTTAVILPTCVFRDVPAALSFPDIDPSKADLIYAEAEVTFSCTRDSSVRFAVNNQETGPVNAHLTQAGGTATIGYQVTWDAPANLSATGLAKGHSAANWASVKVKGGIAASAYQDAAAGNYTDATGLKLSINP